MFLRNVSIDEYVILLAKSCIEVFAKNAILDVNTFMELIFQRHWKKLNIDLTQQKNYFETYSKNSND